MLPRMLTGLYLLEMPLQNNTFFTLRMMTMQHFYTGKILGFSFCQVSDEVEVSLRFVGALF